MKPNYLSASRITQYLMCPLKYQLQYEDKVEWDFHPSNLALGSCVHSAIEGFYRSWQDKIRMSPAEVTDLFQGYWTGDTEGKKFEPECDASVVKQLGQELLEVFARDVDPGEVIAVEDQFRVQLADPETGEYLIDLVGIVDLIEFDKSSKPVIVDHKTMAKKPSDRDLQQNLQLSGYAYAYREFGDTVYMRINGLLKNKKPVFEQFYTLRTVEDDYRFFKLAQAVLNALEKNVFPPNPGWVCSSCQVKSHCYYGKEI